MKIKDIKKKLLEWTDFYGQDIAAYDEIEKCETKEDCYAVLMSHKNWMIAQNVDACFDLENFAKKLKIPF